MNMHAIIMAGGAGTRFWPASRRKRPKQFLPLADGVPLIQASVDRVRDLVGIERIWIVTNPDQADSMIDLLDDFPRDQVIIEPEARDTAPCIALAAAMIENRDRGARMVITPSDHLITPTTAFHERIAEGAELVADDETLVTFGIAPDHPATGFGYIELGNAHASTKDAYQVLRFREKPDLGTAKTFVSSGQFLWNSGIFVWNYAGLTRAMAMASPELAGSAAAMLDAARRDDPAAIAEAFRGAPRASIDYAVMEHADKVVVLRANFDWHDLGSFPSLAALVEKDAHGNAVMNHRGASAVMHSAENCTVYGEGKRTVALFGVNDLVVVHTDDAILVCPKSKADNLKEMIQSLRDAGREDIL